MRILIGLAASRDSLDDTAIETELAIGRVLTISQACAAGLNAARSPFDCSLSVSLTEWSQLLSTARSNHRHCHARNDPPLVGEDTRHATVNAGHSGTERHSRWHGLSEIRRTTYRA